ncbi:MAG TPA: GlsB/YeaQ/YmgE family stress response membrane protein [Candidatus Saccharimonadales bacterium]|nr:GlsB/YeaQ/YmgE family stress response membrane protein [Candidatus Saccharimonadales bacterium]
MLGLVSVTLDPGSLLVWAVIGLIAGFLASKVMTGHGKGVVADIVVGVIGAIAGGFIARYVGVTTAVTSHSMIVEIVIAFAGAVILLAILRLAGFGKRRSFFR